MVAIYGLVFIFLALSAFFLLAGRAQRLVEANTPLHSRPVYHGLHMASLVLILGLAVFILGWPLTAWIAETRALAALPAGAAGTYASTLFLGRWLVLLLGTMLACVLSLLLLWRIAPEFRARAYFE